MRKIFFSRTTVSILIFLTWITFSFSVKAQCPVQSDVNVKTHTDVICFGASTGTITVDLRDASTSEPFNFELRDLNSGTIVTLNVTEVEDKPNRSVVYSAIPAGNYSVLFFKLGCAPMSILETVFGFVITEPTALTSSVSSINPSCNGNDGSISLNVSGGTPVYTYNWTGPTSIGNTIEDPTGLAPGTYSVSVRDANYSVGNPGFCEVIISNIIVPAPVTPSVSIAAVPAGAICSGTSVTFTATPTDGGTPSYQWKKGVTNVGSNSSTYTDIGLSNGDAISVVMTTSLTCVTSATATSNVINMSVTTPVTPSVSIAAVPVGAICSGTSVTFTATPTNGGTPSYQWKKGVTNVGSNSATYTDIGLANGDAISVVMTTSLTCVTSATATSNVINMSVTTPVTPSVSIAAVPVGAICSGTSVTFTATPTNGGTPSYQWKKGVTNVGSNSATYTDIGLANGDAISVVMTTSLTCVTSATATSNVINMSVTTPVTPTVSIAAVPVGAICSGTSVTFTATPTNGGTPSYQWKKGVTNVGANSATYTDAALVNGDAISVVMTTSLTCVTSATATSNVINMSVTTPVTPSVSIAAVPAGAICSGTSVTFTATPTNGGTPSYQWKKGVTNVGSNSATYTDIGLANGDAISVVMTTSLTCVTSATATSNVINMSVTTPVTPSVSIAAVPVGAICSGTSVTFTATPTNGGTPSYQWKKGVTNVGSNSATYTDIGLANGDAISVVMTTSLTCVTSATATSNVINMSVTTPVTPSVSIAAVPAGAICSGTSVTFTATPTNGGTPSYQWKKGVTNVGSNSATYTDIGLANGDAISVVMTTSLTCVTSATATSNVINMSVTTPVTPTVSIAAVPVGAICSGMSVTFTATPTNGGTPSYQWKKGVTNVGANSATYTDAALVNGDAISVVMTTSLTCVMSATATSNTLSMTVNANVIASVSISSNPGITICTGTSVTFTAVPTNGGSTPIYQWKKNGANVGNGGTTYTDAGLVNGNVITVEMTSNAVCPTPVNVTSNSLAIIVNPNPTYNALVTDVSTCVPGNDGSIAVTALGGSGTGYSYSKDNGLSFPGSGATFTFTSLTAGNYLVVVRDGAGCVSPATNVTVNSPVSGFTFTFTQQNVVCNGGNDGSITITPSGGSGTYSYSKDNGVSFPGSGASFIFSSLTSATYPIVVRDGNGCQFSTSVVVTQPALVSFTNVKTDVICNGASDGTITVTTSGGNGVYTYSKDNGATFQGSNVFLSLSIATYQVIVKDGNNCLSAASGITIGQPSIVTFTNGSTNPTTCSPGNEGTITIAAAGGNGTYQYSNDNGATFQLSNAFTGLAAGSYQVIVRDINGCLSAMNVVALTAPGGLTFTSVKQDVVCNGGLTGSITLTASGGSGGNQFSKNGGTTFQVSNIFSGLAAGTYPMIVRDNLGCQFSASVIINEPSAVTFTSVNVNLTCNGSGNGSITITPSGGNNVYQYSKDNGATFQLGSSFSSLAAAIYQVVVKDGNNCISVAVPISITEPTFVSGVFSGLAGPYCTSSGVVNLIPTTLGGTFTGPGVSGSTFSPSLAGAGTHTIQYSVTIGGCSNFTTQTVSVISSVVDGSFVGLNPTYCLSSIAVTLTPATTGGIFSGSGIAGNIFNPSSAGSGTHLIQYSVVSGACTSTTTQSVNVLLSTDPFCTSGFGTGTCATVVIVPTPTPATCTSSDGKIFFSITPSVPIINTTGVKIDVRGISSTNLGVSRTNFNDPTFLNLPIGTYDFSIEYGEVACTKTGQVTVGQSGTVGSPVASNIVRPLCFGEATGSLTLDVPGETGNLLEWSLDATSWIPFTAGSVITGVPAGVAPLFDRVISVRRNSTDLCNAALIIILQEINPAITATIVPSNATCSNNDGLLTLSDIGGGSGLANFTYKLNGADIILPADKIIKGLSAGTYALSIIDNIGCQKDLAPVNVSFPGYVNYTVPVATAPDCAGTGNNGSISFQITDSGSFLVGYTLNPIAEPTNYLNPAGAPIIISNLSNGNYFIWIKSSGAQCATKLSPISINGTFPINFNSVATNILCFGSFGEIKLTSIKGAPNLDFTFELLKGGVTSSGLITVSQSLGEVVIPSLTVGNYQLRLTQNQSSIAPACTSPIVSLYQNISITGPSESLDTLYVNKLISVPDLATGSMLVGIKESNQDPYEVMLELIDPLFPGQEFIMDWTATIFNKQNLKFELAIRSLFAGDYKLSLRDGLGCVKEYDLTLDVDTNIAVPNVFTPNGDGFNDLFFIRNLPADANLIITNRWGKEVFSSGGYQNDWGGGDISDGVYFYRLNFSGDSLTGWVEILRGK